jgi:tight adherence protein C
MNTYQETLLNLFGNSMGGKNGVVMLLAVAIFFVGMVFMMLVARYFDPVKTRLDKLVVDEAREPAMLRWAKKLDHISHVFIPKNSELQKSTLDRLSHAGYRARNSLVIYYFIRTLAMILLPALVLLVFPFIPSIEPQKILWYAAVAAIAGMIGPSYYLDKKIIRQQRLLRNGLPDAIDLLVVCTEAGLGLNAAILRVAKLIVEIHPVLAEELLLVSAEMRAGVDRTQAMANLAKRSGVEDIKGLVAVLAQSMRFGTSISQTLRIYAEEFRDKRMQKADEEAAKLSTKMIFPLVLFIFPSFFIVAIGPAVIKLISVFSAVPH